MAGGGKKKKRSSGSSSGVGFTCRTCKIVVKSLALMHLCNHDDTFKKEAKGKMKNHRSAVDPASSKKKK